MGSVTTVMGVRWLLDWSSECEARGQHSSPLTTHQSRLSSHCSPATAGWCVGGTKIYWRKKKIMIMMIMMIVIIMIIMMRWWWLRWAEWSRPADGPRPGLYSGSGTPGSRCCLSSCQAALLYTWLKFKCKVSTLIERNLNSAPVLRSYIDLTFRYLAMEDTKLTLWPCFQHS